MKNTFLQADLSYTFGKLSISQKNKLENATILMTGCGGFLGYYFMQFLKQYAANLKLKKIIALDNFMLGTPGWLKDFEGDPLFSIRKFDIIGDKISSIPEAETANYIIHMASIASPVFYRQFPLETLDANIWGLRSLFDFYVKKDISGLLFFSSSEIYGDPSPEAIPTNEEYRGLVSCTGPRACYDESKRFGETMCALYSQKFNLPVGVVRPFNNYGPGMRLNDKRVPADFAKNIIENKDITILSDGSPTRTFCYIADAVAGYLKVLLYGKYDYFNIGIENPEITIQTLASIYVEAGKELFNYSGKVIFNVSEDKNYLVTNPLRRCPDISKARKLLGYNPEITVQDGVSRFLNYIKASKTEELEW